jgi:pimeloyl-ACP methyl ester carboxylesterase
MSKAMLAVLAAGALALAGCTNGSAPAGQASSSPARTHQALAAGAPPKPLRWRPCPAYGARLRCASLRVPLDYTKPGGRKITLALSEVPATAPAGQRLGDLLVNPGGPGAPGLSFAGFIAGGLQPAVAARYTIVGFDTRGVGTSVPALHCDPSFFAGVRPNYVPASKAAERVLIGRARGYAAGCQRKFGWLLPYMTTRNLVQDLNSIRLALGQQEISYFGYSYGTYLGQVYATLFPGHLRRMVLDSTVNPKGAWYADNLAQDYAFQGRMDAFFAWVARYHRRYQLGSTQAQVSQSYYAARTRLAAHPAANPSGPPIGADQLDDAFEAGGYDNAYWPVMAAALASYLNAGSAQQLVTDFSPLAWQGMTERQYENEFAVYNAVECADVAWPRSWGRWDADARRVYRVAPFETWLNVWFNAACAFWPVHGPARPVQIKGAGLPGILMLQGALDAATPYAGAQVAHRLLPSAKRVVVEGGGNHGQSLANPPDACVNRYLNRYLVTGGLPSGPGLVNATCPAVPDPAPAG